MSVIQMIKVVIISTLLPNTLGSAVKDKDIVFDLTEEGFQCLLPHASKPEDILGSYVTVGEFQCVITEKDACKHNLLDEGIISNITPCFIELTRIRCPWVNLDLVDIACCYRNDVSDCYPTSTPAAQPSSNKTNMTADYQIDTSGHVVFSAVVMSWAVLGLFCYMYICCCAGLIYYIKKKKQKYEMSVRRETDTTVEDMPTADSEENRRHQPRSSMQRSVLEEDDHTSVTMGMMPFHNQLQEQAPQVPDNPSSSSSATGHLNQQEILITTDSKQETGTEDSIQTTRPVYLSSSNSHVFVPIENSLVSLEIESEAEV